MGTGNKRLSKEQKLILLKNFLKDDIYVKALTDTLSDEELDKYLDLNIEALLIGSKD